MMLPYDVARCPGVGSDGEWREGCDDCLRRLVPPAGPDQVWMEPPAIIAFWCEYCIEAEGSA